MVQSCTEWYIVVQYCTAVVHSRTELYGVYGVVHSRTELYGVVQCRTELVRSCT